MKAAVQKTRLPLIFAGALSSAAVFACPSGAHGVGPLSAQAWREFRKHYRQPRQPASESAVPWGGSDAAGWKPEAIFANAAQSLASGELVDGSVADITVAVPLSIQRSGFHPYGDGQSNAALSFSAWKNSRPPLIAALEHLKTGELRSVIVFDRGLGLGTAGFELARSSGDRTAWKVTEGITKLPNGDVRLTWTPPSDLNWRISTATAGVWIRPFGMADWFPIMFRHPVVSVDRLFHETLPEKFRSFGGRSLLDPEGISAQSHPATPGTPFERLQVHAFGEGYHGNPYYNVNIHGTFPQPEGSRVTGVSEGWTWLVDRPTAPFKILYTCFGKRRTDLETASGVPTSGGWHEIGDPAETILNSLETVAIPVGWGALAPLGSPPSGSAAYGLSDVATYRMLRPGEALVTAAGGSTWNYGADAVPPVANFHWFAFPFEREVCTEEWVHPCRPTDVNRIGLGC